METFVTLYVDILDSFRPVYEYGLSNGWIYMGFSLVTFIFLAVVMSTGSVMHRLEWKPTSSLGEIFWIINHDIFEEMGLWLLFVSMAWPLGILLLILLVVLLLIDIPRFCLRLAYLYSLKTAS